jgi:hypothetical protein
MSPTLARNLRLAAGVALAGLFVLPAHALHVTSLPNATPYTQPYINLTGRGPYEMGPGVVWTSNSSQALFGYGAIYGLGSNGYWQFPMPFAGTNANAGSTMRVSFATPVAGVLAWVNHIRGFSVPPTMSIFDSSHQLLESYMLDITTGPGSINDGEFHGFQRAVADIAYVTFSGSYIVMSQFAAAASPVPEPAGVALMLLGLATVGAAAFRRKMHGSHPST